MVIVYRLGALTYGLGRLLVRGVRFIGMPNIIAGREVVPELLQRRATAQNLADTLVPLIGDTPQRRRQCEGLARLDAVMEIGVAVPSARAAAIVVAMAGRAGPVSSSDAAC